jgi:ATP-dependent Clp protease ATP-binding subunit ClpB
MYHQQIGPEHVLEAMTNDRDSGFLDLIALAGGNKNALKEEIRKLLDKNTVVTGSGVQSYISQDLTICLNKAQTIANAKGDEFVTLERILQGMLESGLGIGKAINSGGITGKMLEEAIAKIRSGQTADSSDSEARYNAIGKYCRDLTAMAQNGKIDPVIGRDEEIRRIVQILSRRTKNNPVIIPRNHKVEESLKEAHKGNLLSLNNLLNALKDPYTERGDLMLYQQPAPESEKKYKTFCGT